MGSVPRVQATATQPEGIAQPLLTRDLPPDARGAPLYSLPGAPGTKRPVFSPSSGGRKSEVRCRQVLKANLSPASLQESLVAPVSALSLSSPSLPASPHPGGWKPHKCTKASLKISPGSHSVMCWLRVCFHPLGYNSGPSSPAGASIEGWKPSQRTMPPPSLVTQERWLHDTQSWCFSCPLPPPKSCSEGFVLTTYKT